MPDSLTYRQLDHWCRKGWIHASAPGSGMRREFARGEREIADRAFALTRQGIIPQRAIELVRQGRDMAILHAMTGPLSLPAPWHALIGKQVVVTLDYPAAGPPVIARGVLLGMGTGGDVEVLEDDGMVRYCWPALKIEAAPAGQD
jgi:hypothetical protein